MTVKALIEAPSKLHHLQDSEVIVLWHGYRRNIAGVIEIGATKHAAGLVLLYDEPRTERQ